MAAAGASPSGFSYAQAAKGRSLATPPSKVTSGVATPATGQTSETAQTGNWADDVEASVGEKEGSTPKDPIEQTKATSELKANAKRTKIEEKGQNGISGVSSPDLVASGSATSKDDDWSAAVNGTSSESTWESKSTASVGNEPTWIVEREKRQTEEKTKDAGPKKGKKKGDKAEEPPKPVVLTESAPPVVNPWAKRAEEAKAKMVAVPTTQPAPRPTQHNAPPQKSGQIPDNQHPRPEQHKKVNSIVAGQSITDVTNTANNTAVAQGKRGNDARPNRPGSKSGPDAIQTPATANTGSTSSKQPPPPFVRPTVSTPSAKMPPSVKDEVSWPTPETAIEHDRKAVADKEVGKESDKIEDDSSRPRKKTHWQAVPVVPNVIWATANVRDRGSRGLPTNERGRGGGNIRGRAGFRGAANGAANGDRPSRSQQTADTTLPRGRSQISERPTNLQPAKAARASSAGSTQDRNRESRPERPGQRAQSSTEALVSDHPKAVSVAGNASFVSKPARQQRSPPKEDGSLIQNKIPEPIPAPPQKNPPTTTQRIDAAEGPRPTAPPFKVEIAEGRKGRSFDGFKEAGWNTNFGARRGTNRGGRGRGGREHIPNGNAGPFANLPEFQPSFNAVNPFSSPRGGHKMSAQGRNWHNQGPSGPRSQSIPLDALYGRYNAYPPQINTFVPGPLDYNSYPMSAMPFSTFVDHHPHLPDMVRTQLEYYFSNENMEKDFFLRRNMDSQGFVLLELVAGFNRIQSLTMDTELLKQVCLASDLIEIRIGEDGKHRLRMPGQWSHYVLPIDQRDKGAQNDGPQRLQKPELTQVQTYGHAAMQMHGPASAGLPPMHMRHDRRSYDNGLFAINGMPPYTGFNPVPEKTNGNVEDEEMRGRSMKSPAHPSSISPSQQRSTGEPNEEDTFPNGQIENLTVVVRSETAGKPKHPFHHLASRTFSNGSIDTRSIFSESDRALDGQHSANGDARTNGAETSGSRSRHSSPSTVKSPITPNNLSVFWVKDKEAPVSQLPSDVQPEPYLHLRMKALDQRAHAATGNCPYDMDVLYQFWSHFLIRNFNNSMYNDFKQLAIEDADERHSTIGMTNLTKYYSEALLNAKTIRDHVLKDYVDLVKKEVSKQHQDSPLFKQLRCAWRNGAFNLKNRKKLGDIADEELKTKLDSA